MPITDHASVAMNGSRSLSHRFIFSQFSCSNACVIHNLLTKHVSISAGTHMHITYRFVKPVGILAVVMLMVVLSGPFLYAYQTPFPIMNYDFAISASTTLVRMQPGSSGALVIWVSLFCPNSTSTIRCDSTVLQTVTLQSSGCPSSSFCMLDRTQLLVRPLYGVGSNFVIYSFAYTSSAVTTITVTGTDQFGDTHSTQFGVVLCDC